MDLYRFFHPHHNPRLRNRAIRLQELSELELAAKELYRALERASIRITASESEAIPASLISASSEAIELAAELLHQMVELQPEDSEEDMKALLEERKSAPGWEAWCILLRERIEMIKNTFSAPATHPLKPCKLPETKIQSGIQSGTQSELDDSLPSVSTLHEKKIVSA